ncbi:MAG: ribbon-helix-helix protein, CopG family [Bacteroidota bacterium]
MSSLKQFSFRLPESSVEQLDEMVEFFESRSRSALLKNIIDAAYEDYKLSKDGMKNAYEMVADVQVSIGEIERRLAALEAKCGSNSQASRKPSEPQKTSEPAKTPQADKKASSAQPKPVTTAGKNFQPDEITRMVQEKPADWSDEKLAEEMNKKGLTTALGKPCSKRAIHKWRHNLNTRGTI